MYLTGTCGIDSLDEIAYLDGIDDVDNTIKGVTNPGDTVTTCTRSAAVTSCNNGIPVSIRGVANLNIVLLQTHRESSTQARCQLDQPDFGS
jgi:hypothetical protein